MSPLGARVSSLQELADWPAPFSSLDYKMEANFARFARISTSVAGFFLSRPREKMRKASKPISLGLRGFAAK